MNQELWKSLFRWLETASLDEIALRQSRLREILARISDRGLRSDIRRMRRLLEQEVQARQELARLRVRPVLAGSAGSA